MKKVLIFIFGLTFSGCVQPKFYEYYLREDLFRLPLIEPYELLNIANDDQTISRPYWNFKFPLDKSQDSSMSLNVSQINVKNEIIFGHGQFYAEAYPNQYFILQPKISRMPSLFRNRELWLHHLSTLNIDGTKTFDVWDVFNEYRRTMNLPWHKI